MDNFINNIFSSKIYIPHGHCYLWQTPLVLLHLISDLLIAIAYFSIPLMLLYFLFKRSDVPFQGFFIMFGAFIIFCGVGHLLEILTLWYPAYWLTGFEQALTAIISCYTAINMAKLLPVFLSLKTPEELELLNQELQKEIVERQKAEAQLQRINTELETRVQERTLELQESAQQQTAITKIVQRMRQTLDSQQIFTNTTKELRKAINCDRVLIYQFNSDWSGQIVTESNAEGYPQLIDLENQEVFERVAIKQDNCIFKPIQDTYLQDNQASIFSQKNSYRAVTNVYEANFDPCYLELLEQIEAKAYLVVPVFVKEKLWGLLFAYQLSAPRQWKLRTIQIMIQIAIQLGVALQQVKLLLQTQQQTQELQIAKNEADRANHAKSLFLANMSHELRTPLNAVLGYTQIMQDASELPSVYKEYINIINSSGIHLLSLINDVLEMSKIEAGQITLNQNSFNLHQLLAELENLFRLKAESKNLKLSFEWDSNVPQYIKTDRQKLRQILTNILGNAIKFTEQGKVSLKVWVEEQKLFFAIQDTGFGIAQEEIDQIFIAFKQAEIGKQSHEGTGLGLSISNAFVELMGGKISVSSKIGEGTSFTIAIPLVATEPLLTQEFQQSFTKPIGLATNQPEFRILVVEDRLINRKLIVKILTSVGFKVKEAVNGKEAIAIWQSWQPQLIWMDMQMPVMDGFTASQKIKASPKGKDTVIIALTATAFTEDRQKILACGCDDMVSKPFRTEELFEKMAQYLRVKYIYQANNQLLEDRQQSNSESQFVLDSQTFQIMNLEWIKQFRQKALEGNYIELHRLIEKIPLEHKQFRKALLIIVENFQFDKITNLLN